MEVIIYQKKINSKLWCLVEIPIFMFYKDIANKLYKVGGNHEKNWKEGTSNQEKWIAFSSST